MKPKRLVHLEIQRHRENPIGIFRSTFRDPLDGKIKHLQHGRLTGMTLETSPKPI